MTLEGARQVHNRRLSRLECAKFAIARFQRLICCLWQEFSHGLQDTRTKIRALIFTGFLAAQVRSENIPPFTAGVLSNACDGRDQAAGDSLDPVREPYTGNAFRQRS